MSDSDTTEFKFAHLYAGRSNRVMLEHEPVTFQESTDDDPAFYSFNEQGRKTYFRLRVYREDNSYFSIAYQDIRILEGTADGTMLSICVKGGITITITGERLHQLASFLEDESIRRLILYCPKQHTLKSADFPIITGIIEGDEES